MSTSSKCTANHCQRRAPLTFCRPRQRISMSTFCSCLWLTSDTSLLGCLLNECGLMTWLCSSSSCGWLGNCKRAVNSATCSSVCCICEFVSCIQYLCACSNSWNIKYALCLPGNWQGTPEREREWEREKGRIVEIKWFQIMWLLPVHCCWCCHLGAACAAVRCCQPNEHTMTGLHFNLLTDVATTQARLIEHTKMWHWVRPSSSGSVCVCV